MADFFDDNNVVAHVWGARKELVQQHVSGAREEGQGREGSAGGSST